MSADTAEAGERVFSRVRQSVVALEIINGRGKPVAQGGGVAIREGELVTTCEVVSGGVSVQVQPSGKTVKAVLRHERRDLNICQLEIAGLRVPPVPLGTAKKLRVGERVYAVGMSSGQRPEPVVSSAKVSGLLPHEGSWYMQISPVLSSGFQGGGLFNDRGELVGILSPQQVERQNLTFALPVDWIRDMEKQSSSASLTKKESGLDWLNRSFALEKKGDWPGLLKLSQQQLRRDPDSAAAWFEVGTASVRLKQYKQAVHAYREAIRNHAGYGDAWHGLGTAYARLREYDHAIDALRDAVHFQPENAEAWSELGNAYHEAKRYPYAIHAYRESLRFEPENPEVWYSLGKTYDELKLYGDAIEAYRETVRIQPKNVEALYRLGVDYAISEERAEMGKIYRALRELDPAKAEQYFNTYILP